LNTILEEAKSLQNELVQHRRYLHEHAETEFDLPVTVEYVWGQLKGMGYEPRTIGHSGVTVTVGGKNPGKTFLLRADMDALPIQEQTDLPFTSQTGAMHACGHDMHTAMLPWCRPAA
jgi:hippurate hydrolase